MGRSKNIIINFILEHKVSYVMGIMFMLLGSYVQTLVPNILGKTIDVLGTEGFVRITIINNMLFMLVVTALGFMCTFLWRNLIIRNSRRLEYTLRDNFFANLQKLSPAFYSKRKTGDLIAYAINDINAVRMLLGPATAMTINGLALSTATIISMTRTVDFKLAIMCLVPVPFIVFFMLKMGKVIQNKFRKVQQTFGDISGRIQENIYGIRVIKAYSQEEEEVKNFQELNNRMMNANLSMTRVSALLSPSIELCFSISFVLNLIIGGNLVLKGSMSIGDFVAFNTYLGMIMGPIISIGRITNLIQRGTASYKRLNEVLAVEPDIVDGEAEVDTEVKGSIEIKSLSFAYPEAEENSLEDINISIPQGYTLGIIGKTGSGKTTLANLLLKFFNVDNGSIFINDVDINDYKLTTLRDAFGYVPQDNFLFHDTVKNNVTFFRDIYSEEDVKNSLKNSCIYESIDSLQDKMETILGERGVNLSGGQKQRISIARALIKDPEILILDDSLSAVDTVTEKSILNNLKRLRQGKTTIIIAHKISSISHSDEIIVLDKGRICERGTHIELLTEGGVYYDIYKEQEESKRSGFAREII